MKQEPSAEDEMMARSHGKVMPSQILSTSPTLMSADLIYSKAY